jgi:type III secretion protein T
MDWSAGLGPYGGYATASDLALLLGLCAARVAVAFLLVPLFTNELLPAMVRNALFLAVALLAMALQPLSMPQGLSAWQWVMLFGKEAFIGGAVGLLFAGTMWAFESAGQVVDTKVGSSMAQVMDPLSGHQTSLTGAFLARLASWVFMAGGGFMLLVGTLLESYALWPVTQPLPRWQAAGAVLFEQAFGDILRVTLLLAAPALVLMVLVDAVLGLVNRFAQQLNVFSLSMSIKSVLALWILFLQVGTLVALLSEDLLARPEKVLQGLRALVGGG